MRSSKRDLMRNFVVTLVILALVWCALPARADSGAMRVYIPRIGLDLPVGECPLVDGYHIIGSGVCHLEGTATIDHDWARITLAGHTPGIFSDLVYVREGDQIMLWNSGAVEIYRVVLIAVTTVDDTQWLQPTTAETLTLITCAGDLRRVVHAERES